MNELVRNINNSHKFLFYCKKKTKFCGIKDSIIYYNLDSYSNNDEDEGRICLFNSHTCSVEVIAKFHNSYSPYQVAATQNKVSSYVRYFE